MQKVAGIRFAFLRSETFVGSKVRHPATAMGTACMPVCRILISCAPPFTPFWDPGAPDPVRTLVDGTWRKSDAPVAAGALCLSRRPSRTTRPGRGRRCAVVGPPHQAACGEVVSAETVAQHHAVFPSAV